MHVFLCRSQQTSIAKLELSRSWGIEGDLHDCYLTASAPLPQDAPPLAFTPQVLPNAEALSAPSISQWSKRLLEVAAQNLPPESPWRYHIFPITLGESTEGVRRSALVEESFLQLLKQRRRSLLRSVRKSASPTWAEGEGLVQLCLTGPESGFLSVTLSAEREQLRRVISPAPRGFIEIARDERPPSRAYKKLLEAEKHFGRTIQGGEVCVDLGASPGGWSFVALDRGASVIAVDRAPLREDLMSRADFVQGDAFRFSPRRQVDWLLCDLIAFPERSIELLNRWLSERWCRAYCVTLKFRGSEDYSLLEEAKKIQQRYSKHYFMRQLYHNKNEVTAFGEI